MDEPDSKRADGDEARVDANDQVESHRAYWHANLRLLGVLMTIWFAVSFGAGILFRSFLDQFSIGGYPLGFWFAQQGAIYVFLILIAVYVVVMHRIDRKFDLDDDED